MYYKGRPLGDELDDNSTTEDGYRFHDALHLANAAILGWSPVLRSLMGLKRKYDPSKDNAEDGARARIVEEAIVKAAHSEALRAAQSEGLQIQDARKRLFSEAGQIPYPFLKLVRTYADGLEVQKSEPWEWQKAIVEGQRLYVKLLEHKQGTITVNLLERSVSFKPLVIADFRGPVVASTIEGFEHDLNSEQGAGKEVFSSVEKRAILKLLGISDLSAHVEGVEISYSESNELSIKLYNQPQFKAWEKSIVGFRREWTQVGKSWLCLMMAIGAPD